MVPDGSDDRDEGREVHERLALPLLIPAVVFLFAVLVIYGLSRIYLELDQWEPYGDVSLATPLAIGVALAILLTATYLAGQRAVSRAQIGFIVLVGAALLTGGAIWAAAHEDKEAGGEVVAPTATPGGTPAPPGTVNVSLIDPEFSIIADPPTAPAGSITFNVSNEGSINHNLRVIKTDLDQADLPVDSATFAVDEDALDVVGEVDDFPSGQTEELAIELESGPYVLICNVPTHYESGMHTAFEVGPPPGGP
jgi:hypothetical protein